MSFLIHMPHIKQQFFSEQANVTYDQKVGMQKHTFAPPGLIVGVCLLRLLYCTGAYICGHGNSTLISPSCIQLELAAGLHCRWKTGIIGQVGPLKKWTEAHLLGYVGMGFSLPFVSNDSSAKHGDEELCLHPVIITV